MSLDSTSSSRAYAPGSNDIGGGSRQKQKRGKRRPRVSAEVISAVIEALWADDYVSDRALAERFDVNPQLCTRIRKMDHPALTQQHRLRIIELQRRDKTASAAQVTRPAPNPVVVAPSAHHSLVIRHEGTVEVNVNVMMTMV